MYCQTSSSVQLEIGKTRTCSPLRIRPLYSDHSSGRWFLGSHWPKSSRKREDALLGAGALLVAAGAAEGGVEAVLGDRVEQRRRLQAVARRARTGLLAHAAGVDRVLDVGDDQPLAELLDEPVAELDHLGEVVPGVDVHHREREASRAERLLGQAHQHDRVLAAAEQQHRPLELGGDLTHDEDRLGLERLQVRELVLGLSVTSSFAWQRFSSDDGCRTRSCPRRPSGRRGRCRAACTARSRSNRSPGRAAGCTAGRA